MSDQRTLRKLHEKIRTNTAHLLDYELREIYHDSGNVYEAVVPSLLYQLKSSISTGNERTGRIKGKGSYPLVMAVHAFDVLRGIEVIVSKWGYGDTYTRIRSMATQICSYPIERISEVRSVAWYLETWVIQIKNLLDPPRQYNIAAPCPQCGERVVRVYHTADNEYIFHPALRITTVNGVSECTCQACDTVWPETHFVLLAQVLGCEPIA